MADPRTPRSHGKDGVAVLRSWQAASSLSAAAPIAPTVEYLPYFINGAHMLVHLPPVSTAVVDGAASGSSALSRHGAPVRRQLLINSDLAPCFLYSGTSGLPAPPQVIELS